MTRSSTASWAILAACFDVIPGSKLFTFDAMFTLGMAGSNQTRADAEVGAVFPAGGRAAPAVSETHTAVAGPLPVVSVIFGVEPSGSSANGCGLRVDRSAATGSSA